MSPAEAVELGAPCRDVTGVCADVNAICVSATCQCKPQYFTDGQTCRTYIRLSITSFILS